MRIHPSTLYALIAISPACLLAQAPAPYRPAIIPFEDPAFDPPAVTEVTPAELAAPPVGQIQKLYLREVNQLRGILAAKLAAVPMGAERTESPWFRQVLAYNEGLDAVAASSLQSDCFALIPKIAELLASQKEANSGSDMPLYAMAAARLGANFGRVQVHAIERHLLDQKGTVSAADLARFCTVFSIAGFYSESDWEASPIPIDSAGILILDPAAVVTHLKARPWQEAEQFLGNNSASGAFARYAASGNGMAVLKSRYAANEATIQAKWNELAAWVVAQRPPN